MNQVQKINREFQQKSLEQIRMIFPAAVHVFYFDYGWKKLKIQRMLLLVQEVILECAATGTRESMLSMLEKETGIEMVNQEKKSYHEYAYLDESIWDGKEPTLMQLIYMRKQQMQWLPQVYLSAILIALHRKEKFGYERLADFINKVQAIRFERGIKSKNYRDLLNGSGITMDDVMELASKGE